MTYTFLLSPKAQDEILEAWEWYEDQRSGLGDRFKDEVYKKIKYILDHSEHYPLKRKYHEAQTDVFPFLIIYKINKPANVMHVISVFLTSRHPKKKYK